MPLSYIPVFVHSVANLSLYKYGATKGISSGCGNFRFRGDSINRDK